MGELWGDILTGCGPEVPPPHSSDGGAGRGLGVNPRQLTLDAPNILIFNEYLLLQNTFHTIFCTGVTAAEMVGKFGIGAEVI